METQINIDFGYTEFQNVELTEKTSFASVGDLRMYDSSIHGNLKFYRFEGMTQVNSEDIYIAVRMKLPNYFDNYGSLTERFIGLFLFRITSMESMFGTGKYGCPQRIYLGPGNPHFTFMGNNFYPFVTVNYEIGYYVCESGGDHEWPKPNDPDYFTRYKVSINYPITYDPMLGLYTTRDADAVS